VDGAVRNRSQLHAPAISTEGDDVTGRVTNVTPGGTPFDGVRGEHLA
jgi:hypothetical protein